MTIEKRKWDEVLMGIMEGLVRLEVGLAAIQLEMARLEAAGIYPAVPAEVWECRRGERAGRVEAEEKKYLRLTFPVRTPGIRGRKLYVGCNPARVARARELSANRVRWERLERERGRLERHLRAIRGQLDRVAGSADSYQIPEALGIELSDVEASAVTKCPDCEALIPPDGCCWYCENKPSDLVTSGGDHLEDPVTNEGEGLRRMPKVEYNVEGQNEG